MATSLNGTTPAATYESLLKLGDNSALSATLKRISDGAGNDTPIEISTAAVQFGGSTGMYWDNTNKRLGIGTNAPTTGVDVNGSIRAGVNLTVVGEIQNPTVGVVNINGTLRVASPNVSIGLTSYPARLAVRGSGATSATTALRVENSAGSPGLLMLDNKEVQTAQTLVVGAADATAGQIGFFNTSVRIGRTGASGLEFRTGTGSLAMTIDNSQNVGVGTATPDASSLVDITSTTKGFLPPRMTTTQKNAIATPAAGLVVYDTTTNKLCCYNGTTWNDLF